MRQVTSILQVRNLNLSKLDQGHTFQVVKQQSDFGSLAIDSATFSFFHSSIYLVFQLVNIQCPINLGFII